VHEHWPDAPPWLVESGWPVRDGELRYYGSADGTSWFLVVLAATGDAALQHELEPQRRAAADWLTRALERGGGLVRHGPRRGPGGLAQQGWRDTVDPVASGDGGGILHPDGSAPEPPLADADSQAAAHAALRALGDHAAADALRERISTAFDPETMALEAGDRPVRGAGSQLGWLLWADALSPEAAERACERLTAADVLTGFGLRTLSAAHPRFTSAGYHRGSVWPFDSWLGWGGLRAHGRDREAELVRTGVLAAIERLGGAPELYAVTDAGPEPIAIANRMQAWTIGAQHALEASWDGRVGAG
jgi:glycogen debranching enzyme